MSDVAAVYIYLECGTPRTGLWCDACLLPSGVEVDVWSLRPTGLLKVTTRRGCENCGARHVGEVD